MIKMQDKHNSVLGYLYVNKDSYDALDLEYRNLKHYFYI